MQTIKNTFKSIRNHTLKVLYSKRVVKVTSKHGIEIASFPLFVYLTRAFYDTDVSEHTYKEVAKVEVPRIQAMLNYYEDLDDRTYGIVMNEKFHRKNIT